MSNPHVWWCTLGSMPIRALVTSKPSPLNPVPLDLTKVISASMRVVTPSGAVSTWGAVIEGTPTPTTLIVAHYLNLGDLSLGVTPLTISVILTTLTGSFACDPFTQPVDP